MLSWFPLCVFAAHVAAVRTRGKREGARRYSPVSSHLRFRMFVGSYPLTGADRWTLLSRGA